MNTNYNPNQPGDPNTPSTPQESDFWKNPEPQQTPEQPPVNPQAANPSAEPVHTQPDSFPQTPYQTPVRSSADTDQPIYHDQAHQTTEPPFAAGSASYHTYQEWQAQENKRQAKKNRKPRSKKPFIIAGSVVAAIALFCGGLFLGSSQLGSTNSSSASSSNQNLPTLTISSTPKDGSSSSSADGVLSGEEIYQKLNDSIVAIQSADESGQVASSGSGVVMSEDGYNITNAHVIADENTGEPMSNISVLFADGSQLTASVVGSDDQTDLAVLKVEPTSTLTPAEFGDSDQLQVGEDAYAIGSPGGVQLANSMTSGIISAINRDITVNDRVMSLIQTNVTINPGNLGWCAHQQVWPGCWYHLGKARHQLL